MRWFHETSKFFLSGALLALLLLSLIPLPAVKADTTYTSASDFPPYVYSFNGSVLSLDGATYTGTLASADIKADGSWVSNTTAEYFEFSHYANLTADLYIFEYSVPDCYMGMDVWANNTLKTGDAAYTLSVNYLYNGSSPPAKDWNALGVTNPSNTTGAICRVQLSINSGATQVLDLKVRIYYATVPSVGYDGVDDYVHIPYSATLDNFPAGFNFTIGMKNYELSAASATVWYGFQWNTKGYGIQMDGTNYRRFVRTDTGDKDFYYSWTPYKYLFNTTVFMWDTVNSLLIVDGVVKDTQAAGGAYVVWGGYFRLMNIPFTSCTEGQLGEVHLVNGSGGDLLWYNASAFTGNATTTVTDFSGQGNTGTASGNVQYKVYTGTGFKVTMSEIISITLTRLPHGIVGYWSFEENTGTTAHDTAGSLLHATIVNSSAGATKLIWVAGHDGGYALWFNNTGKNPTDWAYLDAGNSSLVNFGNTSFSISLWAIDYAPPSVSQSDFVGKASFNQYRIGLTSAGKLQTTARFANVSSPNYVDGVNSSYCDWSGTTAQYPSNNTWHHYVYVYNNASHTVTLYVDGGTVGSYNYTNNGFTLSAFNTIVNNDGASANAPLVFGVMLDGSDRYFVNCSLDDIMLFVRALSPTEVSLLYTGTDFTRTDVGYTAGLARWTVYESDGTFANVTVTLNSTLLQSTVGSYGYTVSSISDPDRGCTAFSVTPVTWIFDRINITSFAPWWEYDLTVNTYGNRMVKPALLNGSRYILVSDGMATQSPIGVYSANSDWDKGEQLGGNSSAYGDFYAFTFPAVWNDTIVVGGHVNTTAGFIGYFNTTDYTWNITETTNTGYITQVAYIESENLFMINPVGLNWNNSIMTSSPENLFSPSAWAVHNITDYSTAYTEHMFTYNQKDGYCYILQFNMTDYNSRLIKWNMTDDTMTYPLNSSQTGTVWAVRPYISSNSTTLFFSMPDNSSVYRYYYSNDGAAFTNFLNLSRVDGGEETHGNIYPWGNDILVSSIRDGNYSSHYAFYKSDGTLIEDHTGFRSHYSENKPITDGEKIIIGGEGGVTAYADLHILSDCNHTNTDSSVRININDTITWAGIAGVYESDGTPATFTTTLNDTILTQTMAGSRGYSVSSITNPTYALTGFDQSASDATVTWDRVECFGITQNTTRIEINNYADLNFQLRWDSDSSSIASGTLYINGTACTISSGWANLTATNASVVNNTFAETSVESGEVTMYTQTPADPWVVWDSAGTPSITYSSGTPTWTIASLYDSAELIHSEVQNDSDSWILYGIQYGLANITCNAYNRSYTPVNIYIYADNGAVSGITASDVEKTILFTPPASTSPKVYLGDLGIPLTITDGGSPATYLWDAVTQTLTLPAVTGAQVGLYYATGGGGGGGGGGGTLPPVTVPPITFPPLPAAAQQGSLALIGIIVGGALLGLRRKTKGRGKSLATPKASQRSLTAPKAGGHSLALARKKKKEYKNK